MNKGLIQHIIIFLFTLTSWQCMAQEECRETIKSAIEQLVSTDHRKAAYSYKICTIRSDKSEPNCQETSYVQLSYRKYMATENHITYSDNNSTVTIRHDQKSIAITNYKGHNLNALMVGYRVLYDSLISKADLVACYDECEGVVDKTMITFELLPNQRQIYKTERISYVIVGTQLKEMHIDYIPNYMFKSMSIYLDELDEPEVNVIQKKLTRILDNPELLKSNFKNYKFIDKRG